MFDLGQCDGQIQHRKNKKSHKSMVLWRNSCRRDPARHRKPGLVEQLKELVEKITFPFLSRQNEQQGLTQHGQKPNVDKQLRDVQEQKQDGSSFNLRRTVVKLTDPFLTNHEKFD